MDEPKKKAKRAWSESGRFPLSWRSAPPQRRSPAEISALSCGRTTAEGSGLGLPLAKRIAELHGGTIQVSSRKGQGASFTVYLPLPSDP